MNNMQFNDLLNKTFTTDLSFSQQDINKFAEISGDNNPIHIDLEFAAKSKFGKTIAHGMLVYAVISEYLAKQFPGLIQISQTLSFLSPVYAQEELTLLQEVIAVEPSEGTLQVKTSVTKLNGTLACQSLTILKIS
jgi:3-hydroxybutyryl-CoA dehydratase